MVHKGTLLNPLFLSVAHRSRNIWNGGDGGDGGGWVGGVAW